MRNRNDFVSLHTHTQYSLLDGAANIKNLVARAKELGQEAIAITDHGAMYGVIEFYKECKRQGVKPIIGCEVYLATNDNTKKGKSEGSTHLILLAKNKKGYHNLCKIVTDASVNGFYYKPRTDFRMLEKYHEGLICLSGCIGGLVPKKILSGHFGDAKRAAKRFKEIFGQNNFYIEVQDHGIPKEHEVLPKLYKIAEDLNIPLAATNDIHYIKKEDAIAQDALLCIQTKALFTDTKRMRMDGNEFYMKSTEEMYDIFKDHPEAITNTKEIADRCNVEFEFGRFHLPRFQLPEGFTNSGYLRYLCDEGFDKKYGKANKEAKERLKKELSVIEQMGYVDYFLIVWDFINYAKSQGIYVGPGRGSAAGSVVSYCLDITMLDPLKYDLIFERFLNPERVSMPDIDVDFCYERRGEVIDYVTKKYGKDCVCQIATFGTLKPKMVARDLARVYGMTFEKGSRIASAIPDELGMTLDKALDMSTDLKKMYETDYEVKKVIDIGKVIEGAPRHLSTHAAGVVISSKPVVDYMPLVRVEKGGVATQFEKDTVEEMGLLKMDFLGLKTLTVIKDTVENIEKRCGKHIDINSIDTNDPTVYKMIAAGKTAGVFQLESGGMTQFMTKLKPDCFEDIIAGVALYRPGPMDSIPTYIKNKKRPKGIKYDHPCLKPILENTYGCMIYQEQVMRVAQVMAGYSLGHADILRRAMGKKKMHVMKEEEKVFIEGARNNGISEETAKKVYDGMIGFAQYAFNKSHAAVYALISYQTAWLKLYYPAEYMAALMSSVMDKEEKLSVYINECKNLNLDILPPSLKESDGKFSVTEDGKIRFGLLAVKGAGEVAVSAMLEQRDKFGRPESLDDFLRLIDASKFNKKTVQAFAMAGAFSCFGYNRKTIYNAADYILSMKKGMKKTINGQISLFDKGSSFEGASQIRLPSIPEFSDIELAVGERSVLGVYLTTHPLDRYKKILRCMSLTDYDELKKEGIKAERKTVKLAGIFSDIEKKYTKKTKEEMAIGKLESNELSVKVIAFPKTYRNEKANIKNNTPVVVTGVLQVEGEDSFQVNIQKVQNLEEINKMYQGKNILILDLKDKGPESHKDEIFRLVKSAKKGDTEVHILLKGDRPGKVQTLRLSGNGTIALTKNLENSFVSLIGDSNTRLVFQ